MRAKPRATDVAESVADRLIRVARDLIDETGGFDLPMRDLAARARVSLRTPYQVFGSKSAIIGEILHRDQEQAGFELLPASDDKLSETLFRQLLRGMEFMGARQPFYRALFKGAQGYSDEDDFDTARGIQKQFTLWCHRASSARLLRRDVAPELVAEVLTNLFAAELRYWANSDFDIRLAGLRITFGIAAVLAGLGTNTFAIEMRSKADEFQAAILKREKSNKEVVRPRYQRA
jgi:AcrR family transcriptional regulator